MGKKIIIIGGGPAGYEAALHGAALGGEITLIENHKIGGTCLNYGCIPTKTLIEHAGFYAKTKNPEHLGVQIEQPILSYTKVVEHKSEVVENLCSGILTKLKKAKVNYLEGYGRIIDNNNVEVAMNKGEKLEVHGDAIVIATGSKPYMLPVEGVQSSRLLTSKELLTMDSLPKSITIIGGGVIGMEFGVLLNDFGVQVTIIEYAKNLLPAIDSAIGKRMKSVLAKKGITIVTGSKVTGFKDSTEAIITVYEDKKGVQECGSEYALMAVGRVGNFDASVLDELGVQHNQRYVHVTDQFETSVQNIYAIGDVNGKSLLAHSAYDQGRQLMAYLLQGREVVEKPVPGCVFTNPEISSIGLSEEEVKEQQMAYRSEKTLFSSNGKAQAMGETVGFIKTIINEDGKLLGCHIMGPHAADMIHYASIAMAGDMTVATLKEIIYAHPTLGEIFGDNMMQF